MAIKATFTARLAAVHTGGNAFDDKFSPLVEKIQVLTDGTTASKADLLYVAQRSVATGANDDIDLAGVLTDAFGSVITNAELVGILVINQAANGTANTTNLTIGGATNPFVGFLGGTTPTIGPIRPGGAFMLFAGDAAGVGTVVAGTGDNLRIANSAGATANYQIAIVGRSA